MNHLTKLSEAYAYVLSSQKILDAIAGNAEAEALADILDRAVDLLQPVIRDLKEKEIVKTLPTHEEHDIINNIEEICKNFDEREVCDDCHPNSSESCDGCSAAINELKDRILHVIHQNEVKA